MAPDAFLVMAVSMAATKGAAIAAETAAAPMSAISRRVVVVVCGGGAEGDALGAASVGSVVDLSRIGIVDSAASLCARRDHNSLHLDHTSLVLQNLHSTNQPRHAHA